MILHQEKNTDLYD